MLPELDPTILGHYADEAVEQDRLTGANRLELERSQELLVRVLPPAPAAIADVGGGPGVYSAWLQDLGYEVVLVDAVPLHVEQARARGVRDARLGDARALDLADGSTDAVLLMGPLYHLVEREDRLQAWREAGRVVRPGGVVAAALISRFAALLDGVDRERSLEPGFRAAAHEAARTGVLRPAPEVPFTTAYFHRPDEIEAEVADVAARFEDDARREVLLDLARTLEAEPSVLGASAHLLVVARPA